MVLSRLGGRRVPGEVFNKREVSRLPLSFKYTIIYKTTIVSLIGGLPTRGGATAGVHYVSYGILMCDCAHRSGPAMIGYAAQLVVM